MRRFFSQGWARVLGVWLGSVGLTAVFFHRAFEPGYVFLERDLQRVLYPLNAYWAERVRQGRFPEWYPYDGMGQSYVGMMVGGAFHPTHLLYLFLSLSTAMRWNVALAYAAAITGTYLCLRALSLGRGAALLGGVGYGLGGYLVSMSNNLTYLMAAAALPWGVHASEAFYRRGSHARLLGAAVALALVLFAGDAQGFAVACACVLVQALLPGLPLRTRLRRAALLVACAGALAAPQLLPTLEVRKDAWAAEGEEAFVLRWSGSPLRGVEAAMGPLWLNRAQVQMSPGVAARLDPGSSLAWASSQHLGILAVFFAALAVARYRRKRMTLALGAAFAVLLLLWLGRHAGLYALLHRHLPLFGSFRYPEKLTPFLALAVAMTAAAGYEATERSPRFRRRAALLAAAFGGVFAVLGALEGWGHGPSGPLLHWGWPDLASSDLQEVTQNVLRSLFLSAAALAAAAVALARVASAWARAALVVGAAWAHLYLANQHVYQVGAADVLTRPSPLLEAVLNRPGTLALGTMRVGSYVGSQPSQLASGAADVAWDPQFHAATLRSPFPALWGVEGRDPYLPAASRRLVAPFKPISDAGLFNTGFLVLTPHAVESAHLQNAQVAVDEVHHLNLVRAPNVLPRAYVARAHCVNDETEALRFLHSASFRPDREAAVECGSWRPLEVTSESDAFPGQASVLRYEPERVQVEVTLAQPAVLVLNDPFYSGWEASVDGASALTLPANGVVRAVPVAAGHHRVDFSYRTPGLRLGVTLALGVLAWLLVGCWLEWRRARLNLGAASA